MAKHMPNYHSALGGCRGCQLVGRDCGERKEKEEEMNDWKQKKKQLQARPNTSLIYFCIHFFSRDIIIIIIIFINHYYYLLLLFVQFDSISAKKKL
jgi:hypothetical protein